MTTADALFEIYKELPDEKPWVNIKNPRTDYRGEGEPLPFPNYARTNDPDVMSLWYAHLEESKKFEKHVSKVLGLMTGNPGISSMNCVGSRDTEFSVRGVRFADVAESHRELWKKPKNGITKPYKKHPLYPRFAELCYVAPQFGDASTYILGSGLMGRPVFFEHDGYLYFGTSITGYSVKNYPWWSGVSPWVPIKRWEWEKAKDEFQEAR